MLSRDLSDHMSWEFHLRINLRTCRRVFSLPITEGIALKNLRSALARKTQTENRNLDDVDVR